MVDRKVTLGAINPRRQQPVRALNRCEPSTGASPQPVRALNRCEPSTGAGGPAGPPAGVVAELERQPEALAERPCRQ
jgi:hypothetical protein